LLTLDEVLWLLEDGEWHNLAEITEKCSSSTPQTIIALSFLREYNFIQVDENTQNLKLHPRIQEFFGEIQQAEDEENLGHESLKSPISI